MTISRNNINKATPANITAIVAALTFMLQGLPPIFQASEIINDKTAESIKLTCDVLNIIIAALAMVFGIKKVN